MHLKSVYTRKRIHAHYTYSIGLTEDFTPMSQHEPVKIGVIMKKLKGVLCTCTLVKCHVHVNIYIHWFLVQIPPEAAQFSVEMTALGLCCIVSL